MNTDLHQPNVQVIVGSSRPGRVGRAIADWFFAFAKEQESGVQFEMVDLADWSLPILDEPIPAKAHMYQRDHTKRWSEKIAEGDAYVIVTPEYNHGYPASLKNALDYLYQEWVGKPVAFVGYGMQGGRLAVQQLHQVVDELQMQRVPNELAIIFERDMFDDRRQLRDPNHSLSKYVGNARTLIQALTIQLAKEINYETAR